VTLGVKNPLVLAAAGALGFFASGAVSAQHITIDGRLSPAQTLAGPNYTIGATLGKQVGGNLFQSFGIFGLAQGESATFTGPTTVTNVVGRVTGGSTSSINGAIQSTIPGANVYLINPAGIVFGPNATVNVSGSFHASSADYLRMSDGARFQATNPGGSTLSAASPVAFGFLNAAPPAITVNGSTLGAGSGQTLGLVGGPVSISGAKLSAPAGTIHIASAASAGEIPVTPGNGAALTTATLGPINITGGAVLDASNPLSLGSGGNIFIRAGALTIDASELNADNDGTGPGGKMVLGGESQLTLSDGAYVHSFAQSSGSGGTIALLSGPAGAISLNNGTVETAALGSGNAGTVSLSGGSLSLANRAVIASDTVGSGNSGAVSVTVAGSMSIQNAFTGITSGTEAGSSGNAGPVAISAGTLSFVSGEISSSTGGSGNAGNVSVNVPGLLSINGAGGLVSFLAGIASQTNPGSTGNAGTLSVAAGSLSLTNAGQIAGSTFGSGNAGSVSVNVAGLLSIDGTGTSGSIQTGISSQTNPGSSGAGGPLSVTAGSLSLVKGGQISSSTFGPGNAGSVSVNVAGLLSIDGAGSSTPTEISTQTNFGSTGNAGQVSIAAGNLSIVNGGKVSSNTVGSGRGGDITVSSPFIDLNGSGSQITVGSTGSGNAGTIMVSATTLDMTGGASISTEASTANGGNIVISASDLLYLVNSQITTSVKGASGNGGNIAIDPSLFVLDHSSVIAQAVRGHGGNITIAADQFLPSADSIVSASSQLGISGTVELIGPRVDLNGSLVVLSSELRGAAAVLHTACEARHARPRSSLIEGARGGLMQDVEAAIPALYLADRDVEPARRAAASAPLPGIGSARTTAVVTMGCS
jgi:filamentous hemagglutinin family protein